MILRETSIGEKGKSTLFAETSIGEKRYVLDGNG
jgi:hypothetical protein